MSEYQRSPLYGELSQGTRPTGRTQVRYKYYFIGGLKVLQTNIQIWENTSSEGLIKKIWGVVGFEGISNETRQKRKRTPKRRRQLHLLTLRFELCICRGRWWFLVGIMSQKDIPIPFLQTFFWRCFLAKWDWFVQMVIPERVYRFRPNGLVYHLPKKRGPTSSPV